mgnify:CR=1 FL=1
MAESSGGTTMDPMTAGIAVGGNFLTQYMAMKAAEEQKKKDREVQIAQQYGQDQNAAFQNLMQVYRSALGGK